MAPPATSSFWHCLRPLTEKIRRVGLVANPDKPAARALARQALGLLTSRGCEVLTDAATASSAKFDLPLCATDAELAARADLLLVLGGDGTMLRVARDTAGASTPILGVNLGTLGFLTAASARGLARTLDRVLAGGTVVETRSLIAASGRLADGRVSELALNDFVVSRGAVPRLIELEVRVNGDVLTSYRGDGLIVSSPTGSTAYSLAAGGAVVSPLAEVFALTPICPHTLSNRSVIVRLDARIEVRLLSRRVETSLSADGLVRAQLMAGETVVIRRSRHSTHLVRIPGSSFFDTLRQKLSWSGSTRRASTRASPRT